MKTGMFTCSHQQLPIEHTFHDASKLGYNSIKIWGSHPHTFTPDLKAGSIKQIKALAQTYQMPIISYTPETNSYPYNMMLGNEHMHRESLNMIKLAMDMAKEMNTGYTLISTAHTGYLTPPNVIWGQLAENLSKLCEYTENISMDLILKPLTPYESNIMCNANDVLHALALVPSPHLFSMVNICAPYVQAEPVMSYFNKLGNKLHHLHIVNSNRASNTHYIPGEGKIPLQELMHNIIEQGYEGYCTVELVTMYMNKPRLYAHQALEHFHALLPEDER